jgi:hypothetical protein
MARYHNEQKTGSPRRSAGYGVSIVQAERVDEVEYFHIELDSHEI